MNYSAHDVEIFIITDFAMHYSIDFINPTITFFKPLIAITAITDLLRFMLMLMLNFRPKLQLIVARLL